MDMFVMKGNIIRRIINNTDDKKSLENYSVARTPRVQEDGHLRTLGCVNSSVRRYHETSEPHYCRSLQALFCKICNRNGQGSPAICLSEEGRKPCCFILHSRLAQIVPKRWVTTCGRRELELRFRVNL